MGYRHTIYFVKKNDIPKLKTLNWEDNWDDIENIFNQSLSMELGKMYYGEQEKFIDLCLRNSTTLIPNDDITCELINDDFDILKEYQIVCMQQYKMYYDELKTDEQKLEEFKEIIRKDLWSINNKSYFSWGYPDYKSQFHQCNVFKQILKTNEYAIVLYGG